MHQVGFRRSLAWFHDLRHRGVCSRALFLQQQLLGPPVSGSRIGWWGSEFCLARFQFFALQEFGRGLSFEYELFPFLIFPGLGPCKSTSRGEIVSLDQAGNNRVVMQRSYPFRDVHHFHCFRPSPGSIQKLGDPLIAQPRSELDWSQHADFGPGLSLSLLAPSPHLHSD
jgi:hypothetical protein